jgi:hypothetical protein
MNRKFYPGELLLACALLFLTFLDGCTSIGTHKLYLSCNERNDLLRILVDNKIKCLRFNTPAEAIEKAPAGSGVLILADGYPEMTTVVDSLLFERAREKRLRLYIEYPSWLPGIEMAEPRSTLLERVVVTSDSAVNLEKMKILALHDCRFIPVRVNDPILSVAKVAGFDCAVYGLSQDTDTWAILFEPPGTGWLVSTTCLSQFVTARYAPKKAMQAIWAAILKKTEGENAPLRQLDWTPDVRPSYEKDQLLPRDAVRLAVRRGVDWHIRAKMLLNNQGWEEYKKLWQLNDSNMYTTVPAIDNAAPPPSAEPGDGSFGVLEGIASRVNYNGSQPTRWWLRSDSNGEWMEIPLAKKSQEISLTGFISDQASFRMIQQNRTTGFSTGLLEMLRLCIRIMMLRQYLVVLVHPLF